MNKVNQSYKIARIAGIVRKNVPQDKRPRFELSEKQLSVLRSVSDVTLAVLMGAGIVALTAISPNIVGALAQMAWRGKTYKNSKTKYKEQTQKVTRSIYYLKSKGYIELKAEGEEFLVKIKQKGRKKILKLQFDALEIGRPKNWDGHWWAVIADIPTPYKRRADLFRDKLKSLGFYFLQRTVWVYPHDPRDEVDFVAAYYQIDRYLTIMRVDQLEPEDEQVMKKYFRKAGVV